ncbi:MAG: nucleotidyltransferase [Terracidiphilus sp.]|jgi:hypothetical protein
MMNQTFLETRQSQLDDLLARVCEELQLTPTRYDEAVARYEAVCRWLDVEGSAVASYEPTIYPQGSMRIGTTVKPLGREEYDLDFVCEFQVPASQMGSPLDLLKHVAHRLREHKVYRELLEVKNRCVRLNYANEFHLDILPACPDPKSGRDCIVVPDRQSQAWKPSNPRGYADWFEDRCAITLFVEFSKHAFAADAEPIPAQEASHEKATLKHVVQLLKRWRDIYYQNRCDEAPISMVLTTLAAQFYRGHASASEAMTTILTEIEGAINTAMPGRIYVLNPANPSEDLSERWDDPASYAAFIEGISQLCSVWKQLTSASEMQKSASILEILVGEPTKEAVKKQARAFQAARSAALLKTASAGVISTTVGTSIRPNTFHGD